MKTSLSTLFYRFYLLLLFILLFPVMRNRVEPNLRGVIWSDCEGYFAYLPAVFNLRDVHKVPEGSMNARKNEKGETVIKYTCGVAYFQLPFFLGAKAYCDSHGIPESDFYNRHYSRAIALAGYMAGFIGLFFLQRNLRRRRFSEPVVLLTLLCTLGGTNLFHYMTKEMGTSHVYSFMLFAFLAWQIPRALGKTSRINAVMLGGVIGWITLIRPINGILALLFLLLYDVYDWSQLKDRIRFFREHSGKVLLAAFTALLFLLPQFWYWHEMTGQWIRYSYEGESFIYWNKPKILAVLFDPQNGLFLYSPLVLLSVIGIGVGWREKRNHGPALALIFVLATYLFASWWAWWFGGAFGHRCYVDLYALLAFPLAGMLEKLLAIRWKAIRYAGLSLVLFLIYYGVQMSFLYNRLPGPWDGADWRWNWSKMLWIWENLFKYS